MRTELRIFQIQAAGITINSSLQRVWQKFVENNLVSSLLSSSDTSFAISESSVDSLEHDLDLFPPCPHSFLDSWREQAVGGLPCLSSPEVSRHLAFH